MENDLADSTERQLGLSEVQDHHAYTFKSLGCLKCDGAFKGTTA
jgi:hypothetical protein